ncbi:MAG: FmdB family zinc ribbon protein [Planctomycetota bacterium]
MTVPIYEYNCKTCGEQFEQLIRSQSEERGVCCPACGEQQVERKLSVIATPRAAAKPPPSTGPCGQCCQPDGGCPYQ